MRTLEPSHLNAVANHPDVRPFLKGEGEIDLGPVVGNPENIALSFEGGGWVLVNHGACVYEVHSMFLPEFRGEKVRTWSEKALEYVFLETDAVKLTTRLPKGNLAAKALAKAFGFRTWFTSSGDAYAALHIEDWVQASYACLRAGQEFHSRLSEIKKSLHSELAVHDDDDAHDRAAGAAYLMCKAGNAAKGVWHYNQWAGLAGYAPITLISVNPLMVDIEDAVLHGPNMEVALCR